MLQPYKKSKLIQITVSNEDCHLIVKCVTSTSQLQNIFKEMCFPPHPANMTGKKQNLVCQS